MDITKIGNIFLGGVMGEMAPGVLKGILIELLKDTTLAEASEWVNSNYTLWDKTSPAYQEQIRRFALKLGDLSWLTADWAILTLRDKKPALASLFMGWKKGHNWLERQIVIIKEQLVPVKS